MLRWKQNALSVVASGAGGHRVRRHVSRRAASGVEERLPLRTALRCNHRIHARVVALDHRNKWIGMDRVHVRLKRAVRNHEALLPVGWRPLLGRMQLTTKPNSRTPEKDCCCDEYPRRYRRRRETDGARSPVAVTICWWVRGLHHRSEHRCLKPLCESWTKNWDRLGRRQRLARVRARTTYRQVLCRCR